MLDLFPFGATSVVLVVLLARRCSLLLCFRRVRSLLFSLSTIVDGGCTTTLVLPPVGTVAALDVLDKIGLVTTRYLITLLLGHKAALFLLLYSYAKVNDSILMTLTLFA